LAVSILISYGTSDSIFLSRRFIEGFLLIPEQVADSHNAREVSEVVPETDELVNVIVREMVT
jgi:hypothetical protein